MEVLSASCCGIDVHAKMLVACLIKHGRKETRAFSTMTDDLLRLLDWLKAEGCTDVAIESTGVYWRPVFNILEGSLEVMLVNARDAKGFKARKTDVIDAEWLADLLRHGLLKPSFIPPLQIREVRELTHYRESLIREQTAIANRIHGARKLSASTIQEIIPRKRRDAFMRDNVSPSHQTILPTILVYGLSHNY
jgi:transposase